MFLGEVSTFLSLVLMFLALQLILLRALLRYYDEP
jgi:hypothetical protein